MTLADYAKEEYKKISGIDYKIRLIRGQNPREIFLKGIRYELKGEHIQIYDIDDKKRTIFLINNYPKTLQIESRSLTRADILDRVMRAYLDNIEFLSENSTLGIESNEEEVYPTIKLLSHNESQYRTFICATLSDTEAFIDSEGIDLNPENTEKELWLQVLKGFNNSNKLYENIMFDFKQEMRKLIDVVPEEFFNDLRKSRDSIDQEEIYWINDKETFPNPSLKHRMRDPNWQQYLYNS